MQQPAACLKQRASTRGLERECLKQVGSHSALFLLNPKHVYTWTISSVLAVQPFFPSSCMDAKFHNSYTLHLELTLQELV